MVKTLRVHYLPELTSPEALRGATVVVLDVLRASTTICYALAAGAKGVIPCPEIDDVRDAASVFNLSREEIVLGGERRGLKIDLFDVGNSPAEYTPEVVVGKTVLFTTTNGTKALAACREAHRVLIGAPVNLKAVSAAVADTMTVHLLCAGTDGQITREDILAAGAIVYQLTRDEANSPELDDAATIARAAWRNVVAAAFGAGEPVPKRLAQEFRTCLGGRNLLAIGLEADLTLAADIDRFDAVPQLNLADWRITLPGST